MQFTGSAPSLTIQSEGIRTRTMADPESPSLRKWSPAAIRPLVLCSPNPEFVDRVSQYAGQHGLQTVTCSDATQLASTVANAMPDCIVIEGPRDFANRAINFCDMIDGLAAKLIVVASDTQLSLELPLRSSKAVTVVRRQTEPTELLRCVRSVIQLGATRRAASQYLEAHRRATDKLSDAQRAVLGDVCNGKLNRAIADEQDVSLRTIEQRRRRVFEVLGVVSAAPLGYEVGFAAALKLFVDAFDDAQA